MVDGPSSWGKNCLFFFEQLGPFEDQIAYLINIFEAKNKIISLVQVKSNKIRNNFSIRLKHVEYNHGNMVESTIEVVQFVGFPSCCYNP